MVVKIFPDAACHRQILDLTVKCPYSGCSWTGELRAVEVYLFGLSMGPTCFYALELSRKISQTKTEKHSVAMSVAKIEDKT